ncbi:beta-ketoacyl synthase chain length factor [Bacteroides stercorirosoris]|uniref:Beta-ketoacyl synthase, N-terminal domain n=1 Tax=Bacteroides stercorirosoris TaxID=871324 RepID=A0A1M6BB89_9BACE|nr:beta-ketoacyl synthase chain length factor [Bacteroides stercorirosoris]SHI46010.1 Beta-ketoacyl synthase, N-terminal domain [Bacteroides stercorirosoris]
MQPVYINHIASIHADTPSGEHSYLSANEPDYKSIITNATLRRRMSRIIKMGVACGLECINTLPSRKVDAIITATGLGCLADTEKFLNTIIENEEQLLNPTPFIQSTFNTIGAQIALLCQIHAYNMTYVHRGLSFESALLDSMMRIREGDENVLAGAIDEITPNSYIIQQRLGLLRDIQAGEGAQFFLLGKEPTESTRAELIGISTFIRTHSTQEIAGRIHSFLQSHQLTTGQIDWFVTGKNGNKNEDTVYDDLESNLFPEAKHITFKDECGEYPTASSFAVWKVAKAFGESQSSGQTALIYNHYHSVNHSLILIRKRQ